MVMNNSPDDNPGVRIIGEQGVVSVQYSDGPDGDVSGPPTQLGRAAHRQMEPMVPAAVAQNAEIVAESAYEPDFWTIQCSDAANVEIAVYVGRGRLTAPHARLGANWGRFARLPGRGTNLTFVGVGSQSVTPVVTAYHGWGDIDAGGVQVGS